MREVIVWRIEDAGGWGFYQYLVGDLFTAYCNLDVHVPPRLESGDLRDFHDSDPWQEQFRNYYFGFNDVPQMLKWMLTVERKYVDQMISAGFYHICQYRVREQYIFRGEYQLVFKKAEATRIDVQPYSNILDLERKYRE